VVDLGCGNAYLTFVVHHLLTAVRNVDCRITGVDRNADTVARNNARARLLGVHEQLRFEHATIEEFTPAGRPDLVLALHACDTATDDALALGVRWDARAMLVSPCCHHHLQRQLRAECVPAGLSPVMRHGALREKLGDVLTDAIRASLLGVAGYTVQVFTFVPLEHTARNTLIRAVRQPGPASDSALADYRAITSMVPVRPKLAELLAPRLPLLGAEEPLATAGQ
jgi:SAM-dependent methyltransferase